MLQITVPETEIWDESTKRFVRVREQTLQLEHSLVSLQKWESKWCKPFMTKTEKSVEETLDYIKCMTLTQNVSPYVYKALTQKNVDEILRYIEAPMTATTFRKDQMKTGANEQVTAELIYYWMFSAQIPYECRKWHLNQLLTLIRVFGVKSQPPKKMSRRALAERNRRLNEQRRAQLNSKG